MVHNLKLAGLANHFERKILLSTSTVFSAVVVDICNTLGLLENAFTTT